MPQTAPEQTKAAPELLGIAGGYTWAMNRLPLTLIALLIGILFPLVGFFAGLMPLYHQGQIWWNSRTYVAVPARLESLERVEHLTSKKVPTYKTTATFRYSFDGHPYVGGHASFYDTTEPPGGFQDSLYERLNKARQSQLVVEVWLDPSHPGRAVYDRTPVWNEALLSLPFAVIFTGFGLGAWVLVFHLWRRGRNKTLAERLQEGQPIMIKATNGVSVLVFFTLAWNVLTWSFIPVALNDVHTHGFSVAAIAFLFPVAGLGLILLTGQQLRNRWLAGWPILEITGVSPLRGRFHFRPAIGQRSPPHELMHHVTISLRIMKNAMGGKNQPLKMWEHCLRDGPVARGTKVLDFEVDAPRERMRESLEFELDMTGTKFSFLLPRSCAPGGAHDRMRA